MHFSSCTPELHPPRRRLGTPSEIYTVANYARGYELASAVVPDLAELIPSSSIVAPLLPPPSNPKRKKSKSELATEDEQKGKRRVVTCSLCGKQGHTRKVCNPSEWRRRKRSLLAQPLQDHVSPLNSNSSARSTLSNRDTYIRPTNSLRCCTCCMLRNPAGQHSDDADVVGEVEDERRCADARHNTR